MNISLNNIGKLSHFFMIIILGVMAGFFWTYSINVNQAMLRVDGQTYATVQSLYNITVRNYIFFCFFFGGGIIGLLTVLFNMMKYRSLSFICIVIAFLAYLFGVIVFTHEVNLPLNYYTESWNPYHLPDDWQQTRDAWNQANWIRVFTSLGAFIFALLGLFIQKIERKE